MSDPVLRAYVIGQTPRADLTTELRRRLPGIAVEVVGALDGLTPGDIQRGQGCDYPLETRLRDGTRIVVDAAYVEGLLQDAIDAYTAHVMAHVVLCAGPFPRLRSAPGPDGRPAPLLRPFHLGVRALRDRGLRKLAVLVPFPAQAAPAARKWEAEGFDPSTMSALTERPSADPVAEWITGWARRSDAHAVVFDYVGLPAAVRTDVAAGTGVPVIDLGHLTLGLLAETLRRAEATRDP